MALSNSVRLERFRSVLFGTASAAALLLVAVGIGGIVATGVAQRVRELGIRSAIGASRASSTRMMVLDHLRPIAAGAACGLVVSWWAVEFISAVLYGINAARARGVGRDHSQPPDRRRVSGLAASVDPAVVLRAD